MNTATRPDAVPAEEPGTDFPEDTQRMPQVRGADTPVPGSDEKRLAHLFRRCRESAASRAMLELVLRYRRGDGA